MKHADLLRLWTFKNGPLKTPRILPTLYLGLIFKKVRNKHLSRVFEDWLMMITSFTCFPIYWVRHVQSVSMIKIFIFKSLLTTFAIESVFEAGRQGRLNNT